MNYRHYINKTGNIFGGEYYSFKTWRVYIAYHIWDLESIFVKGIVNIVHSKEWKIVDGQYVQYKEIVWQHLDCCFDLATGIFTKEEIKSYRKILEPQQIHTPSILI